MSCFVRQSDTGLKSDRHGRLSGFSHFDDGLAYTAGRDAYASGASVDACPYAGREERVAFRRGWKQAARRAAA